MTGLRSTSEDARRRAAGWHRLRVDAGRTLMALERLTGINRGELSRIERGYTGATPDQARRLLWATDHDPRVAVGERHDCFVMLCPIYEATR